MVRREPEPRRAIYTWTGWRSGGSAVTATGGRDSMTARYSIAIENIHSHKVITFLVLQKLKFDIPASFASATFE
jgi:hypothetical protein